jgi:hypothetical protein
MTVKELKDVKSSRLNKDVRILRADNCTLVFCESKYKDKLNTLLEFGVINPSPKILRLRLRGKYRNSFPFTKLLTLFI